MEWFKPTIEQLGSPSKYKVLIYIWEHLTELDVEVQNAIKNYIQRVNATANKEVSHASPYVYKLIVEDFKQRRESLRERYDIPSKMVDRLSNYTHARFVNAIEDKTPFSVKNTNEVQWKQHEERNNS